MVRVVIINGYPESGKDLFGELCNQYIKTHIICTSTPMKEAMILLGWDGVKTEEVRNELYKMKQMSNKLFNCTQQYVLKELSKIKLGRANAIVFIQSREPKEIAWFVKELGAESVLMSREGFGAGNNSADMYVEDYDYDTIIINNGSFKDLEEKAKKFVWRGNTKCI